VKNAQPFVVVALLSVSLSACEAPAPEPEPTRDPAAGLVQSSTNTAAGGRTLSASTPPQRPKRKVSAKPVAQVPVSEGDPEKGEFTLDEATKGLEGEGELHASIETDRGTIDCRLYADKAPITVANFVGLARGLRPFLEDGKWVQKPAYDDTKFHRVIKHFMIQGGTQHGAEEAGYVIPDEIWEDATHDRAGLLCMANRGANTNSKQFFIIDEPDPVKGPPLHLDGGYTIFGECSPSSTIHDIASVPTRGDKPTTPPVIRKVSIARRKG
jgi:peptidyl-prolyl cis-trans isomerase A (cyclophilin A)